MDLSTGGPSQTTPTTPLIVQMGDRTVIVKPVPQTLYFLNPEEQTAISDEIKQKILVAVQEPAQQFHTAVTQLTSEREDYERKIREVKSELTSVHHKMDTTSSQLENSQKHSAELQEQLKESVSKATSLQQELFKLKSESMELSHELQMRNTEKQDLSELVGKRDSEIQQLKTELEQVKVELQNATVAKIEAITKVDDLMSREIELDYKEKKLEQEKSWLDKQVQMMTEELDRKNGEILQMQREASLKHLNLQTELAEKCEQLRIAELSLNSIRTANEEQEKHIESLMNKLKSTQELEARMEENYRTELKSVQKVSLLYQQSSEEASDKISELESAVSSLQDLLKNATDKYGVLEDKFLATSKNFQEEIDERDEKIVKLGKELEHANELLQTVEKNGLTDEMIKSLSPAAAAASSMLREATSLTDMFSKYHSVYEQLLIEKDNNAKLNSYLKEILAEIEERAPALKKQKEAYENMEKTLNVLTNQLDLALIENSKGRSEMNELKKCLGEMERENVRLKMQIRDLALQVRTLVREGELARGNYAMESEADLVNFSSLAVPDITDSPAQQVVTSNLVSFRNVEELQSQNQRLLAIVRELSENQEKAEKESHDAQVKLIKESFEDAKKELEDLRSLRESQEHMINTVREQRDMYANLLQSEKSTLPKKSMDSPQKKELELKASEWEKKYNELNEEYETYRRERKENERIASDQMERLRDDVVRMRTENAKLASHAEYNNEQMKVYNTNLNHLKKNIANLEERNKGQAVTIMKYEHSIQALKNEISLANQKLSKTEVELNTVTQERNNIRDLKHRLEAERDMLVKERNTQKLLQTNLKELRDSFEANNVNLRTKLESQLKAAQDECQILRRKVDSENDRFKECVQSWDAMNRELREKLKVDQEKLDKAREELLKSEDTIRKQVDEIGELKTQVALLKEQMQTVGPRAGTAGTSIGAGAAAMDSTITDFRTQIENLERELRSKKSELAEAVRKADSLTNHLELSKNSLEEYKKLSSSLEAQLQSQSNSNKTLTEELSERLANKDDIIRSIQLKCDGLEKQATAAKEDLKKGQTEFDTKIADFQEELTRMRRELQSGNIRLQNVMEENCKLKSLVDSSMENVQSLQSKYEKEINARAEDQNKLHGLKLELEGVRNELKAEVESKLEAEKILGSMKAEHEAKDIKVAEELNTMIRSCGELEHLNCQLQEQIGLLMKKLEDSQSGVLSESSGGPDDPKSSEQFLQLVRYLRREKDLVKSKLEAVEATNQRLESQFKYLQSQYEESQKELKNLQEGSQVAVITSAKQAELLRKVETLSALTDSNMHLREEKTNLEKTVEDLTTKLSSVEKTVVPLQQKASEFEVKVDSLETENCSLKQDLQRWKTRASELLEKSNKVNPEEMRRIQIENDSLKSQMSSYQEVQKKHQLEGNRLNQQIRALTVQIQALTQANSASGAEKKNMEAEMKRLSEEHGKSKQELESVTKQLEDMKKEVDAKTGEMGKVSEDLRTTVEQLNEHKNTVKQVKNIARKYKKQYEDLLKGTGDDSGGKSGPEAGPSAGGDAATLEDSEPKRAPAEAQSVSMEEKIRLESELQRLQSTCDEQKSEIENLRNSTAAMKTLKTQIETLTLEKTKTESELESTKEKLRCFEMNKDEGTVRFAALKSQFEGKVSRLEKENRELKASLEHMPALQAENERLKKDLEMIRQRLALVEKQFKKLPGASGVAPSIPASSEPSVSEDKSATATVPPKANVKPIPAPMPALRPIMPTASIRPMSQGQARPGAKTMASVPPTTTSGQMPQVSTSTPESSGSNVMTIPVTSSAASGGVRQATVPPIVTNVASVHPQPQQLAPEAASDSARQVSADPQPSTSESSETTQDSSEQVSSSEPHITTGTVQPMLSVAPLRSGTAADGSANVPGPSSGGLVEEQPSSSPSSSSKSILQQRATQSLGAKKRPRVSNTEVETTGSNNEEEDEPLMSESAGPSTKRQRTFGAVSIEREAEATRSTEEVRSSAQLDLMEEEPPQVSNTSGSSEHSKSRSMPCQQEDEDSDVIIIESDSEEEEMIVPSEGDEENDDDEDVDEEEEVEEEEDEVEEVDEDEEDDENDENEAAPDDDLMGEEGEDEDMDPGGHGQAQYEDEGREAESSDMRESQDQEDILEEEDPETEVPGQSQEREHTMDVSDDVITVAEESEEDTASSSTPRITHQRILNVDRSASRGSPQQLAPLPYQQGVDSDDGIVPSTPTLFVPRRSDGFAEAVSSPRLVSESRQGSSRVPAVFQPPQFTFTGPNEGNAAGASTSSVPTDAPAMEDTRVDLLLQYDTEGTGRSVPTTPLQTSPPAEAEVLGSESGEIRPEETQQPSSSGQHVSSDESTPALVFVSSVKPGDAEAPIEIGSESNPASNVTSSDEDKIGQQPKRIASPSQSSSSSSTTRVRPTPIVWDAPSSSDQSQGVTPASSSGPGSLALSGPPPRFRARGTRSRGGPPVGNLGRGALSFARQQQQHTRPQGLPRGAGVARRSRPHAKGFTRGTGGPSFQKPF